MNLFSLSANTRRTRTGGVASTVCGLALFIGLMTEPMVFAQNVSNPYRMVDGWAKLPVGRPMGAVGDLKMDPDGLHIWAIIRCTATEDRKSTRLNSSH